MAFQSAVQINQGLGVPGEMYTDAPHVCQSYTLVSDDASYNVFGRAFSLNQVAGTQGYARAGNPTEASPFVGYLVNPKGSASFGTSGAPLAPTLTLPNYAQGELLTMGDILVSVNNTPFVGALVIFRQTDGILSTIAAGDPLPDGWEFGNAQVSYYSVASSGLCVISVDPTLVPPTPAP